MSIIETYFVELGFNFGKTLLKPDDTFLIGNLSLKEKLKNCVFFYESPNQTNTSFYLITIPLENIEFNTLRKYIWNENKADLLFYPIQTTTKHSLFENDIEIELLYSKASPTLPLSNCRLETFKPSKKDLEITNKINCWQFESGAFWLNYTKFLKQSTQKSIDKELIGVLNVLKAKLYNEIDKTEEKKDNIDEVVQALIDRTLYIKYLEDNHIINSYFYNRYFNSSKVSYLTLLEECNKKQLNKLFKEIHSIFNNSLFIGRPDIKDEHLTNDVCRLIFESLKGTNLVTGQLRLFDFQFDVIPVEFISYIYEIFLSKKQKANGIYYTPKKLAQLIIDDVIVENKIGTVLDPSCGSGMFLSVAFQKLLENSKEKNFKTIEKEIEHRTKLLSDNIFGIEKEITAQRFTIFSLSLQLFRGLDPNKIKEYIATQLRDNGKVDLFLKFNLSQNIICANTLNLDETPFEGKYFNYIVGNPPFKSGKDVSQDAKDFTNSGEVEYIDRTFKTREIVEGFQISQCFLIKIKKWSNEITRFGFVSNSSNFYSNAKKFENFFYSEYNIEKIYELSKVKKILFENATESVVSLIFSNQINSNNLIEYYSVEMGIFSEKPFQLLVIQEDKTIKLKQEDLKENKIKLRDYLLGNEYDRDLILSISNNSTLEDYLSKDENYSSFKGFERVLTNKLVSFFVENQISIKGKSPNDLYDLYYSKLLSKIKKSSNIPFLYYPNNIGSFKLINNIKENIEIAEINSENFHRTRNKYIYQGKKILISRYGGKFQGFYCDFDLFFSNLIYGIKIEREELYLLITAVFNSELINYFVNQKFRKRIENNFENIDTKILKSIPIPKELDENLSKQISKITKDLTDGKYEYDKNTEYKLNELIFDLYDLSYIEKQRVRDYFITKVPVTKAKGELERYKTTLIDTIKLFFKEKIEIEFSNYNHNPIVVVAKVYFSKKKSNTANADKTAQYLLNEIFKQSPKENFLASQEKIYAKDCVYIIKDNLNTSWTETRAYEDGQDILKHIR